MHLSVLHKCAFVAFALGVVIMRATPAAAAPSNAEITLFNNTGCTWPVVVGGASVGGAWSPEPPTSIAPGQTLSFGSASNGGVATGTGGTLPIALDTGPASITWSVPWGVFNGGWQDPSGSTDNSKDSGSSYWVSGGPSSCGGQGVDTCLFSYEISVTGKNPTCAVYTDSFKVSAMSQTPVSGCATSIAGSVGAGALATGCTTVNSGGDNIYDYSFSSNSFQQLPGQGAQIASDAGGDRFLVNAQGAIFTFDFTSDQSIQIPGCATSIAAWTSVGWVGGPGEVYITGCTKESNAGYLVYSAPFAAGDGYTVSPNITWSLMPGQGTRDRPEQFQQGAMAHQRARGHLHVERDRLVAGVRMRQVDRWWIEHRLHHVDGRLHEHRSQWKRAPLLEWQRLDADPGRRSVERHHGPIGAHLDNRRSRECVVLDAVVTNPDVERCRAQPCARLPADARPR